MLILTRKLEQSIVIGDNIVVTVLGIDGERVRLGISAPKNVTILRQELCEEIKVENVAAAASSIDILSLLPSLKKALAKEQSS